MAKPKYSFNDIEAAKVASKKAAQLSEKVASIASVVSKKTETISGLNNTFSANTQVCNRFDQLSSTLGDFVEPLNNIATEVKKLVQTSEQALEMSKTQML